MNNQHRRNFLLNLKQVIFFGHASMMFGERILMFLGAATLLLASQDIYVKADKVEIGEGKCNFTDTDTGDWRVEDCDKKTRPFQIVVPLICVGVAIGVVVCAVKIGLRRRKQCRLQQQQQQQAEKPKSGLPDSAL